MSTLDQIYYIVGAITVPLAGVLFAAMLIVATIGYGINGSILLKNYLKNRSK